MNDISNSDDVIDSRDVEKRLDELTAEQAALIDALDEARSALDDVPADDDAKRVLLEQERDAAQAALDAWNDDDDTGGELARLTALRDQAAGYCPDWQYGATLVRDSYFKAYAQAFAEDIGAIPKDNAWPCTCIDWDQAADELRQDYTAVEYGCVTYWVR